ncbi:ZYRO0F10714p [Zygosaccharomyces rouxii]|uniref:ZYRO0F10714p n=1 Tax=Zygosaccharomyces rouxii (strain ATCC 2623 / CBS 732 / NBRC 1130 / NCYC 568 / NRRL Y-229) TaxID=559307 RepID=C5DY69_ZYGRC|nr:uncharacterized protein ZYRO0F10714g [Zygosaccharomyces rouxii]KAH9199488.1 central kinetochore-associated-domain-containing protein [Zygosaccharomyces rouxii]CAR28730.1 ZYRO0F10714p [Zygosaccharomyces rouxii]
MNSAPTTPGRSIENQNGSKSAETVGTHLRRHAHGLSSKRRLAPRVSSPLPKDNDTTTIDKMDVNTMFDTDKSLVKMNHSPIRIDLSSPTRPEESVDRPIPEPKRLKLELASAPNLSQPDTGIEMIEMLDPKNSPQKEHDEDPFELEEAIRESKENQDSVANTPNSNEKMNSILDLHKLTPVYNDGEMEDQNDTPGEDLFRIVSKRNEDLVTQLHHLNRSINEVISSCDSTVGKYRRQIDSLRQDYESKLEDRMSEMASVIQESNTYKERFNIARRRVSETRDEIKMINQNQSILRNKYEGATAELEECRRKLNELEEENSKLKSESSENGIKFSRLENMYQEALRRTQNLETANQNVLDAQAESDRKLDALSHELDDRSEECQKLKAQLEETLAAQEGGRDEKTRQLEELLRHREELESRISTLQKEYTHREENLQSKVQNLETELKSINQNTHTHESNEAQLRQELESKVQECQHWQKNYETVNDDVEILRAEVKELYSDIDEHKELKHYLETSIAQLEEQVNGWRHKYEEHRKDYDKVLLELDSIHLKYNNTEGEHLTELEQLHDNLSSLQITLKKDSELISQLTRKNETLEFQLKDLQTPSDVPQLHKEIESWKEKFYNKEAESNRSLKLLAEDLYIQYSSKHEQKVKLLKKGYETRYQGKLDKLSLQNEGLEQEVDQLKSQLATERKEKQKLIGLLENQTNEAT